MLALSYTSVDHAFESWTMLAHATRKEKKIKKKTLTHFLNYKIAARGIQTLIKHAISPGNIL